MRTLFAPVILCCLFASSAKAQTAADIFLKSKCASVESQYQSILDFYSRGPLSKQIIKTHISCLKKSFALSKNYTLYCKLSDFLGKTNRKCGVFQSYKIFPAYPDALIDLTISANKANSKNDYGPLMKVISEELTMKTISKSGFKSRSDLNPHYYSTVEYFDGAVQLYLDANTRYEVIDHISGKKFELVEDTYLDQRNFNKILQSQNEKSSPHTIGKFFDNYWYIFVGGIVLTSAVATAVSNQEPQVKKITSTESD